MVRRRLRPSRLAATVITVVLTATGLAGVGAAPTAGATGTCPTGMTPYFGIGCTQQVPFTGGVQTRTVHAGFSDVMAAVTGAQGGQFCDGDGINPSGGGSGVEKDGIFPVSTGEVLTALVGGTGHGSTLAPCNGITADGLGGYGGGGDGNAANIPGGGGGSFLWAGSTLEMVSGGGGGVSGGGFGGDSDATGFPQSSATSGLGGLPGTTTGPGAGGAAGEVVEGQPTPPPGNPGTGPTTSTTSLAKGGSTVVGVLIDSGVETDEYSGAGGGGLYAGGSGGCSDEHLGCGGGGGGASFTASNVKPGTPQNAGGAGNGAVVLTYLFGCPKPAFTLVRGGRDPQTGLATLTLEAAVGPVEKCGTPDLQLTGDGVGRAHFQGNLKIQMISPTVARATRDFSGADSCWIKGSLRLTQTETGHATRVATDDVTTRPTPGFVTAKAKRTAIGVRAEFEALGLPPAAHCGRATLLLDGKNIDRLTAKTNTQSGGDLVVRGLRVPLKDDCTRKLRIELEPADNAGDDVARAVRVAGDAKNVLKVCRNGG